MRLSTAGMHRNSIERHPREPGQALEDAEPDRHRQEIPDRVRGSDRRHPRRGAAIARSPTTRNTSAIPTSSRAASTTKNSRWRTPPRCCRARATRPWPGANATLGQAERTMMANDVRQHLAAPHGNGQSPRWQRRIPVRRHVDRDQAVRARRDRCRLPGRPDDAPDPHLAARSRWPMCIPARTLFMGIAERNGVFRTTVSATNTGNATIGVGTVTDPSAWVADNYTLQFTSATDWQVVDDSTADARGDRVGHGIRLGAEHQFPGRERDHHRHAGRERFSSASRPRSDTDIFAMLDELARTLEGDGAIAGSEAAFQAQIGASIMNIDAGLERVVSLRAEVGTRLAGHRHRGGLPRLGGSRSAGADFRHSRCRLCLGDQPAEPAVRQPAGRSGRVFEDLAAVTFRLSVM